MNKTTEGTTSYDIGKENGIPHLKAYLPKIFPCPKLICDVQNNQRKKSVPGLENELLQRMIKRDKKKVAGQVVKEETVVSEL